MPCRMRATRTLFTPFALLGHIRADLRSNSHMPASPPERLEQRLTDVEIKSAFTEDLLDHLNAQVIAQQRQLDVLVREITLLRQQQSDSQPAAFRSLRDELPPHY